MKVGIIGSGTMAQAVARALLRAGQDVMIGATTIVRATQVAALLSRELKSGTYRHAADFGEITVFATEFGRLSAVAEALRDAPGKPLLDCSNPEVEQGIGLTIGTTTSGAEEISKALPQFQVVKALNHLYAELLDAEPKTTGLLPQAFYCGDSPAANALTAELLTSIGLVPIPAGPLASSRYLEPFSQLLVHFVRVGKLDPSSTFFALQSRSRIPT